MIKFNKAFHEKIISIIVAVWFLVTTNVYLDTLPTPIRKQIDFNNKEDFLRAPVGIKQTNQRMLDRMQRESHDKSGSRGTKNKSKKSIISLLMLELGLNWFIVTLPANANYSEGLNLQGPAGYISAPFWDIETRMQEYLLFTQVAEGVNSVLYNAGIQSEIKITERGEINQDVLKNRLIQALENGKLENEIRFIISFAKSHIANEPMITVEIVKFLLDYSRSGKLKDNEAKQIQQILENEYLFAAEYKGSSILPNRNERIAIPGTNIPIWISTGVTKGIHNYALANVIKEVVLNHLKPNMQHVLFDAHADDKSFGTEETLIFWKKLQRYLKKGHIEAALEYVGNTVSGMSIERWLRPARAGSPYEGVSLIKEHQIWVIPHFLLEKGLVATDDEVLEDMSLSQDRLGALSTHRLTMAHLLAIAKEGEIENGFWLNIDADFFVFLRESANWLYMAKMVYDKKLDLKEGEFNFLTRDEIDVELNLFIEVLRELKLIGLSPSIITIAESAEYTPDGAVKYMLERLKEKLINLYSQDKTHREKQEPDILKLMDIPKGGLKSTAESISDFGIKAVRSCL